MFKYSLQVVVSDLVTPYQLVLLSRLSHWMLFEFLCGALFLCLLSTSLAVNFAASDSLACGFSLAQHSPQCLVLQGPLFLHLILFSCDSSSSRD